MESILEKIDDERVFTMRLSDDKKKLNIEEACDRFFKIQLTKKEALKMLDEITHIVNQMTG
jgi:hypothetical protein